MISEYSQKRLSKSLTSVRAFCIIAKFEFRQLYFFTIVLPYILTDSIWSVIISSTIIKLQLSSFKMANFVGKFANWRNYNTPMVSMLYTNLLTFLFCIVSRTTSRYKILYYNLWLLMKESCMHLLLFQSRYIKGASNWDYSSREHNWKL